MKILFRILVVLVVASLIGGVIYAAVTVSSSASQQSSFQRPDGDQFRPDGGSRPGGEGGRDHEGANGGFGLPFGVLKSLAVVAVIAAIYFNASKWLGKTKETSKQIEV